MNLMSFLFSHKNMHTRTTFLEKEKQPMRTVFFLMARLRRLERLTHSLEGCCSIQLSYKRMSAIIILNKSPFVCKELLTKFHV